MASIQDILPKLDALLAAIKAFPDPRRASAEWKQLYNLLKGTTAAGNHLDNAIARRDVEDVTAIITSLSGGSGAASEAKSDSSIDDATLKSALKAFKKRMKLLVLDDVSRIDSRNPMSKGQTSQIAAIEPPGDWRYEVWGELVRRGALRDAGHGTYQFLRDL
ncbi:MAG: hypothetical protein WD768_11020 [Phycisphaeraceae bacterium]